MVSITLMNKFTVFSLFFFIISFLFLFFSPVRAEETSSVEPAYDSMNEEVRSCILQAIDNHPDLKEMRLRIEQSYYQLGQVRASFYPQIDFSSSYTASGNQSLQAGTVYDYSHSFSLRQYITDFGRTSNSVKASFENYVASMCELKSLEDSVIYDVKSAYYKCIAAKSLIEANQESVDAYTEHLKQAEAFFAAGQSSKIEVTSAEVNLTNAKYALIESKNAFQLALVALVNAMGVSYEPVFDLSTGNIRHLPEISASLEDLLIVAQLQRPDILQSEALLRAAEASCAAAAADFAPTVSGSAGYGWGGEHYPMTHSWRLGLTMSIAIADGNARVYKLKEAKARVEAVKASNERLLQNVRQDIHSAFITMQTAKENIQVTLKALELARENFYLAESRYRVGVGSNLEFIDAQVSLLESRINRISSIMDYYVAVAALERAVGTELADYSGTLQLKDDSKSEDDSKPEDGVSEH